MNVARSIRRESTHEVDANATRLRIRVDHDPTGGVYPSCTMRPVTEIRRQRLLELIRDQAEGNASAFGRMIGKSRAQVGFWTAEPGKPGAKNISHPTARAIERTFSKPNGWMDTDSATAPASQPTIPDAEIMTDAELLVQLLEGSVGPCTDLAERARLLTTAYALLVEHDRNVPMAVINDFVRGGRDRVDSNEDELRSRRSPAAGRKER